MSEAPPHRSDRLAAPWGRHDLGDGEERELRLGPLDLRLRRVGEEIWLSRHWTDAHAGGRFGGRRHEAPGDVEWSRWAVPEGTDGVRLDPVFPDRALVVEPEQPFHLVRGARIRVYVRVPLWVAVGLPVPSGITLVEVPTVILSDTWFGDLSEGELSYALPTSARRELRPDLFAPHLAVCPLRLGNDAVNQLEVKKLCLRVSHLSLFSRGPELWSDETRVRYRGEDEESELRITGSAPPDAPDAERIVTPRVPLQRGFTARTFSRLAEFSGLGGSS